MAESVLFSLTKIDDFFEVMIDTASITTSLFDGTTNNFKIVLAEACQPNIADCLNDDGTINTDNVRLIQGTNATDGDCALLWSKGVNSNRSVIIASNSVYYDFADNTYLLKAAFLVVKSSGVVLAYSINNAPTSVSVDATFPVDGNIWQIHSRAYEG